MKLVLGVNLRAEKVIAITFSLLTTVLLLLGVSASAVSKNLESAEQSSLPKYVGLSASAWHQEMDVYFTLKVLSPEKSESLGLREPLLIEYNSIGLIPLKYTNFVTSSVIKDRPYLSSSGLLADIAKLVVDFLGLFNVSRLFGLLLIYFLNILINGVFVFLLLSFGRFFLAQKLHLNLYRLAVVSPWIFLDSTSLMFSPAIRFGGVFALLGYWFIKRKSSSFPALFPIAWVGLVFSSLNGFEFFFFQLSILLIYLFLILDDRKFSSVFRFWIYLSAVSWLTSLLVWSVTVFSNLQSFSSSVKLIMYTFFKHSILRSESPPLGAVTSGDETLGILLGLRKMSSEMSIFLPYPFPESFQIKLGISDELLAILSMSTSVLPLLVLILWFSRKMLLNRSALLGVAFWCLSAIPLNSYVFNHPHHMPPAGLFLLLAFFVLSFRESVTCRDSNS
jgi:hypothetical protein